MAKPGNCSAAMLHLVTRRAATALPSLFGVIIVAFALTRALPSDPAAYFAGPAATQEAIEEIRLKLGLDLLQVPEAELANIRGRELAMVFQNPRGALNPIRQVGRQIGDILRRHAPVPRAAAKHRAIELLAQVRIPDAERRYGAYPFELSGGMCQRVGIAMALACEPALLIADEPTTGLDVTTQAAIMDLILELARKRRMATLLITHDLGLAAEYCERIVVMHAGHVVESAPVAELFAKPRHPYTAKLIASTPHAAGQLDALTPIPGGLPDLRGELPSCRYRNRCEHYTFLCDQAPLPRVHVDPRHIVACRHPL